MHFLEWAYKHLAKPLLFLLDAETAHTIVMKISAILLGRAPIQKILSRTIKLEELNHTLPVGLAAGFDKNATLGPNLYCLGFGFVEVGTVTPLPQPGNSRPRMARLPQDQALVNRMGFNNDGAVAIAARLQKQYGSRKIPLGVNIGKNKETPEDQAHLDYAKGFATFKNLADYFVVNVSSPNTPGLRDLQSRRFLELVAQQAENAGVTAPVFVKLAPEISDDFLQDIKPLIGARTNTERGASAKPYAGVILTNTLMTTMNGQKDGPTAGLSGRPLKEPALACLKRARALLDDSALIISVGGIDSADEAWARLKAGANALQVYSALVYEGPFFAARLNRELLARAKSLGLRSFRDL